MADTPVVDVVATFAQISHDMGVCDSAVDARMSVAGLVREAGFVGDCNLAPAGGVEDGA